MRKAMIELPKVTQQKMTLRLTTTAAAAVSPLPCPWSSRIARA